MDITSLKKMCPCFICNDSYLLKRQIESFFLIVEDGLMLDGGKMIPGKEITTRSFVSQHHRAVQSSLSLMITKMPVFHISKLPFSDYALL